MRARDVSFIKNSMNADVGSLLFILDPDTGKRRPHVCVHVFKNNAGVKYDWLVLPITSTGTVGNRNLVSLEHKKLKKNSFAKLNNITTIKADSEIEIAEDKFDVKYIESIKSRLRFIFN